MRIFLTGGTGAIGSYAAPGGDRMEAPVPQCVGGLPRHGGENKTARSDLERRLDKLLALVAREP